MIPIFSNNSAENSWSTGSWAYRTKQVGKQSTIWDTHSSLLGVCVRIGSWSLRCSKMHSSLERSSPKRKMTKKGFHVGWLSADNRTVRLSQSEQCIFNDVWMFCLCVEPGDFFGRFHCITTFLQFSPTKCHIVHVDLDTNFVFKWSGCCIITSRQDAPKDCNYTATVIIQTYVMHQTYREDIEKFAIKELSWLLAVEIHATN